MNTNYRMSCAGLSRETAGRDLTSFSAHYFTAELCFLVSPNGLIGMVFIFLAAFVIDAFITWYCFHRNPSGLLSAFLFFLGMTFHSHYRPKVYATFHRDSLAVIILYVPGNMRIVLLTLVFLSPSSI